MFALREGFSHGGAGLTWRGDLLALAAGALWGLTTVSIRATRLVQVSPELNVYDEEWPIWTYQVQQPPAKFVLEDGERTGSAINSMVAGGCIVSGSQVRSSLLFSNVRIDERSSLDHAVVLPNVHVGAGCTIRRAIIDEGCEVPDGTSIGFDAAQDRERFFVTERGVVLVTAGMLRPAAA